MENDTVVSVHMLNSNENGYWFFSNGLCWQQVVLHLFLDLVFSIAIYFCFRLLKENIHLSKQLGAQAIWTNYVNQYRNHSWAHKGKLC